YHYVKEYKFNPDPNAKKGRVLTIVPYDVNGYNSGESYLKFDVTEFTAHSNGIVDRNLTRRRDAKTSKIWFAPTTGILVKFMRDGGEDYESIYYSFTGTIAETAMNHHCPYPFVHLTPNASVVIGVTAVIYKCDILVTAPKDYDIRIDHIKGIAHRDTSITIYNTFDEDIKNFYGFPVGETILATDIISISVRRSDEHDQLEMH
ncbi:hypothetical protein PMAYCL1PPCAC_23060, partial [Pristionchus mayeri]